METLKRRRRGDPWSRKLPRILVTRNGEELQTFAEVRAYMLELPQDIQLRSCWLHAARLVMEALQGGDSAAATNQIALALLTDGKLDVRRTPRPLLP